MYRVYCLIGPYRYYWSRAHIWTMWSWAAEPLSLVQAAHVAQRENAQVERFSGKKGAKGL